MLRHVEVGKRLGKRPWAGYTRVVRTAVVLAVMSLGLACELACSSTDSPSSGLNAPCTRSKDCSSSLVCAQGVCSEPDAGLVSEDGGADAASVGDASNDGG